MSGIGIAFGAGLAFLTAAFAVAASLAPQAPGILVLSLFLVAKRSILLASAVNATLQFVAHALLG